MRKIERFEPKLGVICSGFWRLPYIAACPMGCQFCYLAGTYWRGRPRDLTEADLPEIERVVARWMEKARCATCGGRGWDDCDMPECQSQHRCEACGGTGGCILNAGELSDSFAPAISAQLSRRLVEMFRAQDRHTLLLLTKTRPVSLFGLAPTPRVIVSFSLAQDTWLGAPLTKAANPALLGAAGRLRVEGWRVRLCLDPILDLDGTARMIEFLKAADMSWERITLGTLRFTTAGRRALPLNTRVVIYERLIEALVERTELSEIALCKETAECWDALNLDPKTLRCNCVP